jgi:leucine-rich PPR motif-containing protein
VTRARDVFRAAHRCYAACVAADATAAAAHSAANATTAPATETEADAEARAQALALGIAAALAAGDTAAADAIAANATAAAATATAAAAAAEPASSPASGPASGPASVLQVLPVPALTHLLVHAACGRQLPRMLLLVRTLKQRGAEPAHAPLALTRVVEALVAAGHVAAACDVVRDELAARGHPPPPAALRCVVEAATASDAADAVSRALALVLGLRGSLGDRQFARLCGALVRGLLRTDQLDKVLLLQQAFVGAGARPGTVGLLYHSVLQFALESGDVAAAKRLYARVRGLLAPHQPLTLNVLSGGLLRAGDLEGALAVVADFADAGVPPGTVCLNGFLSFFLQQNDLDGFSLVFGLMRRHRVPADVFTLNILVRALTAAHMGPGAAAARIAVPAADVAADAAAGTPATAGPGVDLAHVSGTSTTTGVSASGATCEATVADADADACADEVVSTLLARGEASVRAVLSLMLERGVAPSAVTYTTLISGLCRAGSFGAALDTLEAMRACGCAPTVVTYTAIISALARAGRVPEAFALLRTMRAEGVAPNAVTHTALLHAALAAGDVAAADELADQLLRAAAGPSGAGAGVAQRLAVLVDTGLIGKLVTLHRNSGNLDRAKDIILRSGGDTRTAESAPLSAQAQLQPRGRQAWGAQQQPGQQRQQPGDFFKGIIKNTHRNRY